jgi:16S rRNA (guanine1207-N2)-methyltransferase
LIILHNDIALQLIVDELNNIKDPCLWYADENAATAIDQVQANNLITIITNRYDIYQKAIQNRHQSVFSDFDSKEYPASISVKKIVYRISKEKALTHFLLNQAANLLPVDGTLIISGYKQEGIKTYSDKLTKKLNASGKLKKNRESYFGVFSNLDSSIELDDQNYSQLRKVNSQKDKPSSFYSKPGVFGWNKVDKGTELLLTSFNKVFNTFTNQHKSVLDIGCGYGWIFLNLDHYGLSDITATDNNAAAILSAQKNAERMKTSTSVSASDCAETIKKTFDIVLCNPPFHQGFKHNQKLIERFLNSCYLHLNNGGHGVFVVNEFIALDKVADSLFKEQTILAKENGFKVILLKK